MTTAQIELSFETAALHRGMDRRVRQTRQAARAARAQWWFQRMREVVGRTLDRHPMPPSRPEQICFPVILRGPQPRFQ